MEYDFISIVVPVYNVGEYLTRCLDSLLDQTILDYEIILIDDGSTDESGRICDEYAGKHGIISAFHKENGGLSSARNFGVDKAKGEWVTFVDPDDFVAKTYLEDLLHLVKRFDADMAVTSVERCPEEDAFRIRKARFPDHCQNAKSAFREVYIDGMVNWSGCGKLVKKAILQEYPFPDGYYEDSASAYLHIFASQKIAIGDYPNNYKYILRPGSITATTLTEKHLHIMKVCEDISRFVQEHCPELQYVSVLVYQNAVLQLLTRLQIPWKDYKKIFLMNRELFRKNCLSILARKDVRLASKYYIVLLSSTPQLFRVQNLLLKLLRGQL